MENENTSAEGAKRTGRNRSDLPVGVKPNAFARWIQERGLTVETVATLLKVSVSAVYGYRRGNRPPSRKVAAIIERVSDGEVAAGSWD